jgi:hypothetical protein
MRLVLNALLGEWLMLVMPVGISFYAAIKRCSATCSKVSIAMSYIADNAYQAES